MTWAEISGLVFGVSIDAFIVSIAIGVASDRIKIVNGIIQSLAFSLPAGIMFCAGWSIGDAFISQSMSNCRWVCGAILSAIGINMLWSKMDGWRRTCGELTAMASPFLIAAGFSTSVDTIVVGAALSLREVSIPAVTGLIVSITCCVCTAGMLLGSTLNRSIGRIVEISGAVVMVAVGSKMVLG